MEHRHVYQKDMTGSNWAEVFARQEWRADLVDDWFDGLQLQPGDRVLDVGAGPGFMSLQLAARVGANGAVVAVDRSAEALGYLENLQQTQGIEQIQRVVGDAATVELPGEPLDAALVTMVLHHTDDPQAVLRNVAHLLRSGGRAVVGEFDPEGPCTMGAPREERIPPARLRQWCEAAGFRVLVHKQQSPEHYMLVLELP